MGDRGLDRRDRGAPLSSPRVVPREGVSERCPYCHDGLEGGEIADARVVCEGCGTTHHEACLAELGGCTVLGCSGGAPQPAGRVEEVRLRVRERIGRFVAAHSSRPGPVSSRLIDFGGARERLRERGHRAPVRRRRAAEPPRGLSLSRMTLADWAGAAILLGGAVVILSFVVLG